MSNDCVMNKNHNTYWAWARTIDGARVDIGERIPEDRLSSTLSKFSDPKVYRGVFYGANSQAGAKE